MLQAWKDGTAHKAHFRQLSGLPGTDEDGGLPIPGLPIENHTEDIVATLKTNAICGVSSPPGSGKTMILPQLLRNWAVN